MSALRAPARHLPIAANSPAARRYLLARRHALPRQDLVIPVSGRWAHEQLIQLGAAIESTLWCPGDGVDDRLGAVADLVLARADATFQISERTLARLQPGAEAPGLLSLARIPLWREDVLLNSARVLLVADGIEYAGNLGALLRTVDASGADGLLMTSPVARRTHPSVFSASRGTVLTTPVVEYDDAVVAREALVDNGFHILVADPESASDYRDVGYAGDRIAIVVGSEGEGVSAAWREPALERIAISMRGRADSLNVAAAAAILLFHAYSSRLDEFGLDIDAAR
jgi:TrmH family RNA methyltransferase